MKATCYLVLEPTFANWNPDRLLGFKVARVTKKKPSTPGVVVQLVLDVPDAAFMPLRPVAEVTVGMPDLTISVDVEAP